MFWARLFLAAVSSLWLVMLLGCPAPVWAVNDDPQPIVVEADRMESERRQQTVFFAGNVQATQGDLIIHADEMTVDYGELEPQAEEIDSSRKIKKIFAKGSVEITKEGWLATGDSMEYFAGDRKVLVSGDAKTWQGKNMVTGDSIILYLDEGRSVAEKGTGQEERVKAVIYPAGGD